MKNIRQNVFETNSSSTHSISIAGGNLDLNMYDTIIPSDSGMIELSGGEFGWEFVKYNDPLTKANYCVEHATGHKKYEDLLIKVIKNHTGAKKVVLRPSGYIDHQSVGTAGEAFVNEQTLKNFIFSPGSFLFTGNDNSKSPPNFYDIEFGIEYLYELTLEGISDPYKLQSHPNNDKLMELLAELFENHYLREYHLDYSIKYDDKDLQGNILNSFEKLDQNILIVFKLDCNYDSNHRSFSGYSVKNKKELSFKLKNL